MTTSITNRTRSKTPRVRFSDIKDVILGKDYTLSLVFIGDMRMRNLNRTYRHKDSTTDILSFPLSKHSGEICISLNTLRKRSAHFSMTAHAYLVFLFIHGLLHLKGMDHGRKMEMTEDVWCEYFDIQKPKR